MKNDTDNGDTRTHMHVFRLVDLLERAKEEVVLRDLILEGASLEKYSLYWPVPHDRIAFSGPGDSFDPQYRKFMTMADERKPSAWTPRPNVRFVRLTSKVAQHFLSQKLYFQDPISELEFPDGLLIPDSVSVSSQLFEVTTFSAKIRLSYPSSLDGMSDRGVQSSHVEIPFHEIYIDERTHDDVRPHLQDPSYDPLITITSATTQSIDVTAATTDLVVAGGIAADPLPRTMEVAPKDEAVEIDDPYELKGHSDGVYVLYQIAARCARHPTFNDTSKPNERKKIAQGIYAELLQEMRNGSADDFRRQEKLPKLFGSTRLASALRLIDPEYNPNDGLDESEWRDWPSEQGKKFLAQSDERRRPFVRDMLALIIGGAEQWIGLRVSTPDGKESKPQALQRWLEEHGITGKGPLTTAFILIAWADRGIPALPEPVTR